MKSVYILLTKTKTLFARCIHVITGDEFTHSSIALDLDLNRLYSFGRRYYYMPLLAGLVRENLHTGVFARNKYAPCAVLELTVTDEIYDRIEKRMNHMLENYVCYHYNILGLATCSLGIPHRRSRHFLCSQFVAYVLTEAGALDIPCDISLMRPVDFMRLEQLQPIYRGKLGDYTPSDITGIKDGGCIDGSASHKDKLSVS
ncbi:MAG: hypothetical protein ACYCWE_00290 [Eubacteriales bacterium]